MEVDDRGNCKVNNKLKVTVISTVKNEESSIREFLDSLLTQVRAPDEIIITDGGSHDRTTEIINEYIASGAPIRLIVARGNRSVGRNIAIKNAQYDTIACTDAGCRVDPDWLKNIIKPFESNSNVDIAMGFYRPVADASFGRCVAALITRDAKRIDPNTFLPSARSVAFKKEVWRKVGGFPEQFSWNEDTPFAIKLRKSSFRSVFVPQAIVYWRVENGIKDVFLRYHFYARGDGELRLFKKYFSLYVRYLFATIMIVLGFSFRPLWYMTAFCIGSYLGRYALRVLWKTKILKGLLWGPTIKLAIDFGSLTGFVRGLFSSKRWTY